MSSGPNLECPETEQVIVEARADHYSLFSRSSFSAARCIGVLGPVLLNFFAAVRYVIDVVVREGGPYC